MILLSGHSLTPVRKVPLESLSIQITERTSSATMVPADMTGIETGRWLLDDTEPGKGIVWRVTSISTAYHTDTPTVQMEHVINTLRDKIIFGEHTASTATAAIRMILGFQSDWVLGGCDYTVSNPYKFDGDTLFDALQTVSNSLADSYWDYDLSVYPFKLYIRQKSAIVGARMRAGRNLRTISRKVDRSPMYTRFYPRGKDDLHLSGGGYVERNTTLYGVVEKDETDSSIDSESELRRWANERLAMHAEPVVTVDVEGFELADATGESLDRMTLHAICEIPLPEYNTTIAERIVSLNYPDKIHSPELVKIQLSNTRADTRRITDVISDAIKGGSGGRGGRSGAKQSKEDHAWFEDTAEHVAMCAIGIIGVDAQGEPNWTRMSELVADGTGIHSTVTEIQGENILRDSKIEQNERSISAEVTDRANADSKLSGRIDVQAGKISLVVDENDGIKAASIVAEINKSGSSVVISADHIQLEGSTFISKLTAAISKISLLKAIGISATNISASGYVEASTVRLKNGHGLGEAFIGAQLGQSGNNYELRFLKADGSWYGSTLTFSRAVTSWGVTASGGAIRVTAQPQNQTKQVYVGISGSRSITANGTYTFNVIYANDASSDGANTGATATVTVNVPTTSYSNSGWITYSGTETLPSGTVRYIYYSTGTRITSGSLQVHW